MAPPQFDAKSKDDFETLLRWRRDVRHFKADAVEPKMLDALLRKAFSAPSVGLSQPWRFVVVESPELRAKVAENFQKAREAEEEGVPAHLRAQHHLAKLEGLREAPLHLAAFTDPGTSRGHGLGISTMPEALSYSTVMAVHTLWLAAKLEGLGLGWVSILEPAEIGKILSVPAHWNLTAYLCLGYPAFESTQPDLEAVGWEKRQDEANFIFRR
jgi:5,6-dimethylbenzimidazole synthase